MDEFYVREWEELCQRTRRTAKHFAQIAGNSDAAFFPEADIFAAQDPPSTYLELLDRYRAAATMAVQWREAALPSDT